MGYLFTPHRSSVEDMLLASEGQLCAGRSPTFRLMLHIHHCKALGIVSTRGLVVFVPINLIESTVSIPSSEPREQMNRQPTVDHLAM